MSFFEHVEVLRWHLIRSLLAVLICAVLVGVYYDVVFHDIVLGVASRDFPTYRLMCRVGEWLGLRDAVCIENDIPLQLQNTALFGQITLLLQYTLVFGFVLAFPYIVLEIWLFVAPALSAQQQRAAMRIILACSFFFFLGVLFCYFVIIPFSVNFAVNFTLSSAIKNDFTIDNYINFFSMMLLAMGVMFELPMLVYFLSRVGIIGAGAMRSARRYAIVVILILAGIITPSPDVFTQALVALPLYLLYELSIFIAARNERRRNSEPVAA